MSEALLSTFQGTQLVSERIQISHGHVSYDTETRNVVKLGYWDALHRGDFIFSVRTSFPASPKVPYTIDTLVNCLPRFEIVRLVRGGGDHSNFHVLVRGDDWWADIEVQSGNICAEFGTNTLEYGEELAESLQGTLATRFVPPATTKFHIFTQDENLVQQFKDVAWTDVMNNYPTSTRTSMNDLIKLEKPKEGTTSGKVVLLHGPPGTGKTWAIRSLLTAWKEWAEGAMVLDPDYLLSSPHYMLKMMNEGAEGATRVIILEDADEVVEKRGTRNSGLSRLLNMTDGIVGATRDVLVLITTNASPGDLDKALLRPGRCLASIEFGPFPISEASGRLGPGLQADVPMTLAEIYEKTGSSKKIETSPVATPQGQYL